MSYAVTVLEGFLRDTVKNLCFYGVVISQKHKAGVSRPQSSVKTSLPLSFIQCERFRTLQR